MQDTAEHEVSTKHRWYLLYSRIVTVVAGALGLVLFGYGWSFVGAFTEIDSHPLGGVAAVFSVIVMLIAVLWLLTVASMAKSLWTHRRSIWLQTLTLSFIAAVPTLLSFLSLIFEPKLSILLNTLGGFAIVGALMLAGFLTGQLDEV